MFLAFPPQQVEAEDQYTLVVSEDDLGVLEEFSDAGLEKEADFDDVFYPVYPVLQQFLHLAGCQMNLT